MQNLQLLLSHRDITQMRKCATSISMINAHNLLKDVHREADILAPLANVKSLKKGKTQPHITCISSVTKRQRRWRYAKSPTSYLFSSTFQRRMPLLVVPILQLNPLYFLCPALWRLSFRKHSIYDLAGLHIEMRPWRQLCV
jgi:hypothetical protein